MGALRRLPNLSTEIIIFQTIHQSTTKKQVLMRILLSLLVLITIVLGFPN